MELTTESLRASAEPFIERWLQSRRPLNTDELASRYQVSSQSVLRWIRGGQLKAFRTPGGGRYLISLDEIERFERERS
jgi:excisionase family DNA binding protein